MKIMLHDADNVYEKVAEIIDRKMVEYYKFYSDVLVELRTSNLGRTVEYLKFYGDTLSWAWDKDWYEGGDVELISFIPICEIEGLGNISNAYSFGDSEEI